MAEELGEANAHGVQRLLEEADWDAEAVRDELRSYVIEQLGEPAGMLVVDETGFVKNRTTCQSFCNTAFLLVVQQKTQQIKQVC